MTRDVRQPRDPEERPVGNGRSIRLYEYPEIYQIAFGRPRDREIRFIRDAFRRWAGSPVRSLLDVGCGTGDVAIALADQGIDCQAVDASPHMIRFARRAARQQDVPVQFHQGSMASFHTAAPVDAAVCLTGTIHHLTTERLLHQHFRTMARNLSPGGVYVLNLLVTRPEDEPVDVEQEWEVHEGQTEAHVRMRFLPRSGDIARRRRQAVIEVYARTGRRAWRIRDPHWLRVFFAPEFRRLVERHGFAVCGWYGPDPEIRRRVRQPARHPMVYAVLRREPARDR